MLTHGPTATCTALTVMKVMQGRKSEIVMAYGNALTLPKNLNSPEKPEFSKKNLNSGNFLKTFIIALMRNYHYEKLSLCNNAT